MPDPVDTMQHPVLKNKTHWVIFAAMFFEMMFLCSLAYFFLYLPGEAYKKQMTQQLAIVRSDVGVVTDSVTNLQMENAKQLKSIQAQNYSILAKMGFTKVENK